MRVFLVNAFSLSMLPANVSLASLGIEKIKGGLVNHRLGRNFVSAVGHETTAAVLSCVLMIPVAMNRVSVMFQPGDRVVVAQYKGPRLPEGATTLPEGATFEFFSLKLNVLAEGDAFGFSG